MKSPKGKSTGKTSTAPKGPKLSNAAKIARDIAAARREQARSARETARSRLELTRSRNAAASAGRAAASAGHASRSEALASARAKTAKGPAASARDAARARADAARVARDTSRIGQEQARSKKDVATSKAELAKARAAAVKARADLAKARAVGLAVPGTTSDGWILGGNDTHPACAAAAIANSLLLGSGLRASDQDVLRLHYAAGGGLCAAVSIPSVLAALSAHGLGGARPTAIAALSAGETLDEEGLILDLSLQYAQRDQGTWDWEPSPEWGAHAGMLTGGQIVTWGQARPVTSAFLAGQVAVAWRVGW